MRHVFCIDFGNTNLKIAVFKDSDIIEIYIIEPALEQIIDLFNKYQPQSAILSYVVEQPVWLIDFLKAHLNLHILNYNSVLNFSTPISKPHDIGADRVAICAYANAYFPKRHSLIICLGTCITYNFIDCHGQFLGGGISPGLNLRFKSLHQHTALLPIVTYKDDFPLIGYDTETNILSAVILGMVHEIEGMICDYQERYHHLNVVITGGDATSFAARLKLDVLLETDLIFKGLKILHELNKT
ncbi:MAG: type III pantothenate kinase [Alphaproteobacteria bacterium]|nr:type III pantothenate kinase [Alphaproteobacteria bacterium]